MKQSLIEELKEKNAEMLERIVQQYVTEKDAKIAEMNQTIAKLEKDNESKDQKNEELKQTLTDVQKSLSNSVDINSHLIALHKTETIKFQAQISRRDKLISDLKENVKNTKEEKEVLQAEIIHIKNSNSENLKKIEQQAKKILELGAENATKTFKIAGLNSVHDIIVIGKDNEITELKQEIETCKKEANKALLEKQKIINERDKIIEEEKSLKESLKNTILKLEKDSKRKTLKIYGLINGNYKIITEKDNKITELQQKIKTCKNETEMALQQKQKNIHERVEYIDKNEDKITDLKDQNQNKEQQIINLKKVVKEKQKIINRQYYTIKEEKIEKAKIQNAHQKEKAQLNNKIAALQTKAPARRSKRVAAKNRYFDDGYDFNLFEERTYKKKYRRIGVSSDEDDDYFV